MGSARPTGSVAHIAATRLPSAPRSMSARTDTGTMALSPTPSVDCPWSCMYLPSAPATTASTTSLTVPPSEFLIALNWRRSALTHVNRRWGPIRWLNWLGGAAFIPVQASAPTLPNALPARLATVRGPRSVAWTPRITSAGTVVRSSSESASSWARLGSGRACHFWSGGATGSGSGEVSNSTVAMSTPEIPSTRE